jgi:agrin
MGYQCVSAGDDLEPTRGVCRECPTMCPAIYSPVCGSDGHTYSNSCQLARAACLSGRIITQRASVACSMLGK